MSRDDGGRSGREELTVLIDAGGLIAILDRSDPDHDACVAVVRTRRDATITTWAALAETHHVLGIRSGSGPQEALLDLLDTGAIGIVELDEDALEPISARMRRYADAPMDLADATLVEAAERTGDVEILTLDAHFHAYRLSRGRRLRVLPS
jgi:predicted nucleic acid-binding protein